MYFESNMLYTLVILYDHSHAHTSRHHTYVLANGTVVRRPPAAQRQPKPFVVAPSVQHTDHSMMLFNLTAMHRLAQKPRIQKRQPMDDLLSKNISFLLENLLKRYESSHLPTHGQGEYYINCYCVYIITS